MKDYKLKKSQIYRHHISVIAVEGSPPIKDIKTNKYKSEAPDLDRILLKASQTPRNKPSMPKMPWERAK